MKSISFHLAVSLMVVSTMIGIAIGYFVAPEYQATMYDKQEMGLGPADRWIDLRYINAMIAHHRGAILVAQQLQQSRRTQMQRLGQDILNDEPKLIEELYDWKRSWYGDTRQVADPKVPQFGDYDETFDLRVLNTIIAHHQAGIHMTKEIRLKTSRRDIINNADAVEQFLTGSIETLKEWRAEWYNIN